MTGRPRCRGAGGQATVELVLALPVVLLLVLVVVQVALLARTRVLVVHAAREAARAAAVEGTEAAAAAAAAATPGLAPDRLTVTAALDRRPGGLARVRVRYEAETSVALVGPLVADPVIEAEVAMLIEAAADP